MPLSPEGRFGHTVGNSNFEPLPISPIFRDYSNASESVRTFYKDLFRNQTHAFALSLREKYASPETRTRKATMWEIVKEVGRLRDQSDPDNPDPQIVHALQSAERARLDNRPRWLIATAFIHDVGKILATDRLSDRDPLPQWAVVGDTHILGAPYPKDFTPEQIIGLPLAQFSEALRENPDSNNLEYQSIRKTDYGMIYGIYPEHVGLDNIVITFGHDDYLPTVLRGQCKLPEIALDMIRFHSLYAVHTYGLYDYLLAPGDEERLNYVRDFNQYDLYSKGDPVPKGKASNDYYQELTEEFFPDPLFW